MESRTWIQYGAVAICGLALSGGWKFYGRSIAPLGPQETEMLDRVTELKGRIDAARKTIAESRALEQGASHSRSDLDSPGGDQPASSALVWFPERMKKHLERVGLSGAAIRFNTSLDEPESPDFERSYWAVELPVGDSTRDVREACVAIADIEPVDPSIRVLNVAIRPDLNDPTRRIMAMSVSILARKEEAAR